MRKERKKSPRLKQHLKGLYIFLRLLFKHFNSYYHIDLAIPPWLITRYSIDETISSGLHPHGIWHGYFQRSFTHIQFPRYMSSPYSHELFLGETTLIWVTQPNIRFSY